MRWIVLFLAFACCAETMGERGQTTARKGDWSVGRKRPRNYEANLRRSAAQASYLYRPYVYAAPVQQAQTAMITGPVQSYSDIEYGQLLLSALSRSSAPVTAREDGKSLADEAKQKPGELLPTKIVDVLDRGLLITEGHEEMRMRGVRMPTDRGGDEVTRYYAREGVRKLRELAVGQGILVSFGDPDRDKDGTLIANIYLADGTDLNDLMLENGFGYYYRNDFSDETDTTSYSGAENLARKERVGVWSQKEKRAD